MISGIGRVDEAVLKSDSWNITVTGTLDFVDENMVLDVVMQPQQKVDNIISFVPVLGHVINDKNMGGLDVSFRVKGNMGSPNVEFKPLSNLSNQIFGIIKQTLP